MSNPLQGVLSAGQRAGSIARAGQAFFSMSASQQLYVLGEETIPFAGSMALGVAGGLVSRIGLFAGAEIRTGNAISLYRSVSHEEYNQLASTKTFSIGPNSLEGKFFAESYMDAKAWGDVMNGVGNHQVVEISVTKLVAEQMMRWERLDGIGPARYATLDQLQNVKIEIPESVETSNHQPSF